MSINLFNDRVVCDILTRMTVDETHARTFIQFYTLYIIKGVSVADRAYGETVP